MTSPAYWLDSGWSAGQSRDQPRLLTGLWLVCGPVTWPAPPTDWTLVGLRASHVTSPAYWLDSGWSAGQSRDQPRLLTGLWLVCGPVTWPAPPTDWTLVGLRASHVTSPAYWLDSGWSAGQSRDQPRLLTGLWLVCGPVTWPAPPTDWTLVGLRASHVTSPAYWLDSGWSAGQSRDQPRLLTGLWLVCGPVTWPAPPTDWTLVGLRASHVTSPAYWLDSGWSAPEWPILRPCIFPE